MSSTKMEKFQKNTFLVIFQKLSNKNPYRKVDKTQWVIEIFKIYLTIEI